MGDGQDAFVIVGELLLCVYPFLSSFIAVPLFVAVSCGFGQKLQAKMQSCEWLCFHINIDLKHD